MADHDGIPPLILLPEPARGRHEPAVPCTPATSFSGSRQQMGTRHGSASMDPPRRDRLPGFTICADLAGAPEVSKPLPLLNACLPAGPLTEINLKEKCWVRRT